MVPGDGEVKGVSATQTGFMIAEKLLGEGEIIHIRRALVSRATRLGCAMCEG